jgi:hypothetical protein
MTATASPAQLDSASGAPQTAGSRGPVGYLRGGTAGAVDLRIAEGIQP